MGVGRCVQINSEIIFCRKGMRRGEFGSPWSTGATALLRSGFLAKDPATGRPQSMTELRHSASCLGMPSQGTAGAVIAEEHRARKRCAFSSKQCRSVRVVRLEAVLSFATHVTQRDPVNTLTRIWNVLHYSPSHHIETGAQWSRTA